MILRVRSSGGERGLDSSAGLRAAIAVLHRDSQRGAGIRERAQFLSPAQVFLRKEARVAVELAVVVGREGPKRR